MNLLDGKRYCFFIPTDSYVEGRGYIPSIVIEGEPGHRPMTGARGDEEPWYWGPDYPSAVATARAVNENRGIDQWAVAEIIASSMAVSRV